ncbi:MAG TPA: Type 1 glutamine amidotransferase-like domain-containing protein [Candidatus Saccharimonadia bacterium]
MKTTFLLHGGRLRLHDERNDSYFHELTRQLSDGDEVLFIGFARRDEADRIEVYEREKQFILAQTKLDIKVINATHENLINQIQSAKTIHITGGETDELVKDMQKYPDFIASIRGKVVGGSSAGACLFSTYYFFSTSNSVLKGLGTLPIRLLVHYGSTEFRATDESLELLKAFPAQLELVALEECAWIAKEIDI